MITNKDYVTMQGNVGEIVGDTSSSFKTKIGKWLNKRYRAALRSYQWKELFNTYTFTTVANQATYAMPLDFAELVYIYDNTNKKDIWSAPEFGAQNDTALTASADYGTIKESSVKEQPSSASVLTVVSDSAADTTQTIFISGVSGGVDKEEVVTLNGTTDVSSANSYTAVYKISKSATTTGIVTVDSNSAARTQAVIPPKQLHVRYRILHLYYIPSTTVSIVVRYKRAVLPLTNDYDYPIIDIADEIELGAEADAWRAKRQFMKAAVMDTEFEKKLSERMFQQEQNADIQFQVTPYER